MTALWSISGSCCNILFTSDWSSVHPLQLPGFWRIPGFTWPFPLVTLSLVTQPWDCTRTDPTWSSVDLLDRSVSKTLHCCSAEQTLQGLWVFVLRQKPRNVLLTAHVLGVSTAPVAATQPLQWGLDSTPTLNVPPKYTYMVGAPHMEACILLHYPAAPAVCSPTTCFFLHRAF